MRLACAKRTAASLSSTCPATAARFPRSRRCIRRRAGSSGRPATSSASWRSARRTGAAGSITAAGRCAIRSATARPTTAPPDAYAFLEARGPGLHQIPVGPVHAGIIEPGHFRFHAGGEAVVRLEERLGYTHKGVDALMRGGEPRRAPPTLAGRVSGDFDRRLRVAFARAVEAALGAEAPPRAHVAARRHGGARAARQPFRRHRRDLQRRRLRPHARPLRHPARADAARGEGRLRPSADDGRGRSRRRRRRSRRPRARGDPGARARGPRDLPEARAALRQHRLAAGPHGRDRRARRRISRAGSARAASSAAPRGATSTRAATIPIRPTTR